MKPSDTEDASWSAGIEGVWSESSERQGISALELLALRVHQLTASVLCLSGVEMGA